MVRSKILLSIVSVIVLLASIMAPLAITYAATTNLIANPSVETLSSGTPTGWATGKWGTNTALFSTVVNDGADGVNSVKVQLTQYSSGDAKWYFTSVPVTAGSTYAFSDSYKSTVATSVVAELSTSTNQLSYVELGNAAASSSWNQFNGTLTIPNGVTKVTVYHLIAAVGTLQTDNFSLTTGTVTPPPTTCPAGQTGTPPNCVTPPPPTSGSIANASFETANGTLPANWQASAWGTNSPTFTYLTTGGHSGNRAARLRIGTYTDGDAKWTFDALPVGTTQQYSFSDWYTSTTTSKVYADFGMNDGTDVYTYLGAASTATTWTKYSTTFSVPAGAKTVTVFHLLDRIGTLTTDDYSLEAFTPVGFNRALVSLTFDDGFASYYNNGLPLLQKYGFSSTDYIITGVLGTPGYMTNSQVLALKNAGHEIGSHTVTHPDLTTLGATKLTNELSKSKTTLQTLLNVPITNFAAPYGAINSTVIASAKNYYSTVRGVEPGYNAKNNFNKYNLKVQNVDLNTTTTDMQNWLAQAQATHTWLILVFHAVDANTVNAGQYDVTPAQLDSLLYTVKSTGIAVQTVQQAMTEITPQL